jgi:hypothetical protein
MAQLCWHTAAEGAINMASSAAARVICTSGLIAANLIWEGIGTI